MAADTKPNIKQLRVDNWAVFFLQRLQLLFAKGDHCDLTLKFKSGQELKAHKLILSTCTTFFESVEGSGSVMELPDTLPYNAVHPIINFLYSGRLEFKPELHAQLQSVAKILNITILTQLLVAQKNDNVVSGTTNIGIAKTTDLKKTTFKSPLSSKLFNASSSSVAGSTVAGKKLPIWRPRTIPLYRNFKRKQVEDEEPKPTRFEWPVDESCNNIMMSSPSFSPLSYESAPVVPSPTPTPPPPLPLLKRRVVPPTPTPIPEKFFKPDKPYNEDNEIKEEDPPMQNVSDDDDDDDDGHFETLHTYDDSDDDTPQETMISQQLKPILKPVSETSIPTPSKKVRFSFAPEDKENSNDKGSETSESKVMESSLLDNKKSKGGKVSNHAKIIAEVLKKYPELVKNNKNIKLKITAPGSSPKTNTTVTVLPKSTQGKSSSYVVIKSNVKPKSTPLNQNASDEENVRNNAENTKGPWKCTTCGEKDEPLTFDTYFDYRKHLQNVHMERIDSRICEYCGYKASKRNLNLYHLYTKHNVLPPKNVKFPKCDQCCYIALSEGLLIKHQNSHQNTKELTCQICKSVFKSATILQAHTVTCKSTNEIRNYHCMICKKNFRTNVSLNAHIKVCSDKSCNSNENNIYDEVEDRSMDVIEVPILEAVEVEDHSLVRIPSGLILSEPTDVTLLPSSESEALNNVASGIATSIGLTVALPQDHQPAVILLDGNSQFFLEENESVVVSNENEVHEYMVPEMLDENIEQMYTSRNIPYTVSSESVINCPIEPIKKEEGDPNDKLSNSNSSDETVKTEHNYADGKVNDNENEEQTSVQSDVKEISQSPPQTLVGIFSSSPENDNEEKLPLQESTDINVNSDNASHKDLMEVNDNSIDEDNVSLECPEEAVPEELEQNEPSIISIDSNEELREEINKEDELVKANSFVKEWGFDNEEECDDTNDEIDNKLDPEGKPCRITVDI